MLVAIDLDGTADAAPHVYRKLMEALRVNGHRVAVLTGGPGVLTPQVRAEKEQYMTHLGLGDCYDQLEVFSNAGISAAKDRWLRREGADLLIDNRKRTARGAPCLALVPWATRE